MSVAAGPTPSEVPTRRLRAVRDPSALATAVAGLLLVGGLALAVGDVGDAVLAWAVAGAGVVAALFVLGPALARTASHHRGLLALVVVVAGFVLLVLGGLTLGTYWGVELLSDLVVLGLQLLPLLLVLLAALGGLVLVADDLRRRLGSAPRTVPAWQRLTAQSSAADAVAPSPRRALTGLGLIGFAALAGLGLGSVYLGGNELLELLVLLGIAIVAVAVLVVPLLIAGLAGADRGRVETARADERQRVAAHLHDSVLQTLALVQRQAGDPVAVSRLARRQEVALRAWMAGESELGSETLGAALRDAVAQVEDDHGALVEVTILGDRPLDRQAEALAAAAREALRNAARHAAGAPMFLFAQIGPEEAEVFVRDEGPGFELAAVPTERRGVRDAIAGRMAAAGGEALIESARGEGTEVALRLPAPRVRP